MGVRPVVMAAPPADTLAASNCVWVLDICHWRESVKRSQGRKAPRALDPRAKAAAYPVKQTPRQGEQRKLRKVGVARFPKAGLKPQLHLSNPFLSTLTSEHPPRVCLSAIAPEETEVWQANCLTSPHF